VDSLWISHAQLQHENEGARGFALRAVGIDRMRQENENTHRADSYRNQLNHRTHRGHASPRSIKESPPISVYGAEKCFRHAGKTAELGFPL